MAENIINLTEANFESEALDSSLPVVVDFWAEWCGPCRALTPIIEQLADELEDKIKVAKVNVDEARNVAMKYGISAIPTVIIFKDGEPQRKFVGLTTLEELKSAAEEVA
jgi:thioredoxin 1